MIGLQSLYPQCIVQEPPEYFKKMQTPDVTQ